MAKANFPSSPSNGDTFTVGSIQYTYDSTKVVWNAVSTVANTINDIGNVNAPSPTNNQILKFSNSTSKFELADLQSSVAFNVNGLTDVSAASPSDGQILKYNSSASQYELADGASITAVTAMSDLAALPNPKAGDTVLVTSLNKMFIYSYAAPVTFVVTVVNVSGSNVFAIDGVNNAALTLNRGMTYIFDVSDSSNATHPLGFKTVTNFGTASEAESVTTAGVVVSGTAGSSGATVTYTVPNDASTNLKYYCQTHGNAMGANIVTSSSSGRGWFVIATVTNASPTSISGVDATYTFAQDGTPTVITAVSSDPEGLPITWNYAVTSGSLGSIATISQSDNVFTITPSTLEANAGTFSLTFSATDNINGAVTAVSAFTLSFSPPLFTRTLEAFVTSSNTSYYSNFGLFGDFSESKYILGAVEDNKAILYNATNNTVLNTFTESPNGSISRFGECAISQNYVAVSAYNSGPNTNAPSYGQTGTIYIYSASDYSAITNFQTFGSSARAYLGMNMGFTQNGNYLVATAPRANFGSTPTGKVVVYDANNSWSATQISSPFSSGPFADSNAGFGIGVTNTYFAIGSPNYDSGSYSNDGRVDIFNATSPFAHFRTFLPASLSGVGTNFQFGYSVDAWDDYVIIGSGTSFNKAWIYRMSTGALIVELSTLVTGESNQFGKYVGIGPSGAVVADTGNDEAFFFNLTDIANGNVTANGSRAKSEYTAGGLNLNDFSEGIKVSKVSNRVSIGTYYPQISGSNTASRAYIYS
ncbi:MAG: hypothetical protein CBC83_02360 [Flavobacteriales bacterium TMED123]|mgnify:CR=1 FL=1|nr:hypothetical protein [Candidatus Neomarinimicrobiota bacterium]MAJ44525.1 hypothetical protein [Candidatus Neomarinimicrobiota bacterium]OUV73961.1 MAG: hypothetical protein CBC83_04805 [Flavobacteriales bacterium TMED123]OUV75602.1 MAG: hypothetical protein CBC83_02360 [Flavobacteriales bacterium TMED123]